VYHGVPLTPPRLCPACRLMHAVGTTCAPDGDVDQPALVAQFSAQCWTCLAALVTRADGTIYCGNCHPAFLA